MYVAGTRVAQAAAAVAETLCFSLLAAAADLPAGNMLWFDMLVVVAVIGLVLDVLFVLAYYMEQGIDSHVPTVPPPAARAGHRSPYIAPRCLRGWARQTASNGATTRCAR